MSFFSIFSKKAKKDNAIEDKKINNIPDEKKDIPMGKVITIAREFGSGGREVALKLSQKLGYKFYDKEGIVEAAKKRGIDSELFKQLDEKNMDKFWFTVSEMAYDIPLDATSFEAKVCNDKMFMIQSDTIRELAKEGDVVFVGRCASYILKHIAKKFFIVANMDDRIKRIEKRYNLSKTEAQKLIEVADRKREKYYDYYTNTKWNDVNNYDLVLNVSELGIDGAVSKILEFIK